MNKRQAILAGIVIVILATILAAMPQFQQAITGLLAVTTPEEEVPTGVLKAAKLKIKVVNPLIKATDPSVSGVTVTVYGPNLEYVGGGTTDSSGLVALSGQNFMSGETYYIAINASDNTLYWTSITLPYGTAGETKEYIQTPTDEYWMFQVGFVPLGTFSISVLDPDDNKISSGGSYNATANGVTNPVFTLKIKNTETAGGFRGSENPITGLSYRLVFLVEIQVTQGSGTPMVLSSGWDTAWTKSSTDIVFAHVVPSDEEDDLDTYVDTVGMTHYGTYSAQMQLDTTTMASNSTELVSITVYAYLDLDTYKTKHMANTEAVAIATTSFYLKK